MEVICTTNADGAAADDQCFCFVVHGYTYILINIKMIKKGVDFPATALLSALPG